MLIRAHYEQLSSLFLYPDDNYLPRLETTMMALQGKHPAAAASLKEFLSLVPGETDRGLAPLQRLQEIFTRTFEVQSITTLDVGYLMFGDDYKRAELLVQLNRELQEAKVVVGTELPDHLSSILRLLARWDDFETAQELVQLLLHPAVGAMIFEFREERIEQRNTLYKKHYKTLLHMDVGRLTLFRHLLSAVLSVLEDDFLVEEPAPVEGASAFLRSLGREFEIEERGAGQRPGATRSDQMPSPGGCPSGGK